MLWGVSMIGGGLNKTFGTALHRVVSTSTKNRFKAFAAGALIAVGLQSSMATCVIVSSFAARGIITTSSGISVMLGADVGTSMAAQIMSLDLRWLMPVLIALGFIIKKSMPYSVYRHLGGFFTGMGLVLLSLTIITTSSAPLKNSEALQVLIEPLKTQPSMAVLFSLIFTWMVHSSLGMVLLYTGFISAGVLPLDVGLYMVLGSNIGGAIAPLVMSASDQPAAKRIPLANLLVRFVGVAALFPFVDDIIAYVDMLPGGEARSLVNFHTIFNIVLALSFLPFVKTLSAITKKIVPDVKNKEDESLPKYLEAEAVTTPSLALSCAARETLRICDIVQEMFDETLKVLRSNDYDAYRRIRDKEQIVDSLYLSLKSYLSRVSVQTMNDKENFKYLQILIFATNLEHVGDIIDKGLMQIVRKKIEGKDSFSRQGFAEIANLHATVKNNIQLAQSLLITNDLNIAENLLGSKQKLREEELKGLESHIKRLSEGVEETIATSGMHMDVMSDMRRINSYITLIAYNVVKRYKEQCKEETDA